jgi:hypothetical protein
MNKVIIYTNEQGTLSVVHPAEQARQEVLVAEAVFEDTEHEVTTFTQQLDEETGVVTHAPVTKTEWRRTEISPAVYRDQTDDEFLEWCAQRSVPSGIVYQTTDRSAIPKDRTFRDAWRAQGRFVVEDVEKAKEVTKNILRAKRAALLDALDVEFLQALEKGQSTASVVAEKQRLRDITKEPDKASTVEELRVMASTLLDKV